VYDVIVAGAGHTGYKMAPAAACMGARTLLTMVKTVRFPHGAAPNSRFTSSSDVWSKTA